MEILLSAGTLVRRSSFLRHASPEGIPDNDRVHDAYVAVPSRAAALRAWGSTTDLFAMGAASEVFADEMKAKPLAQPGIVIKISRGSFAEHMAASPGTKSPVSPVPASPEKAQANRPSRAALDRAEDKLREKEAAYERLKQQYDAEDAATIHRRKSERDRLESTIKRLQISQEAIKSTYQKQVTSWQSKTE